MCHICVDPGDRRRFPGDLIMNIPRINDNAESLLVVIVKKTIRLSRVSGLNLDRYWRIPSPIFFEMSQPEVVDVLGGRSSDQFEFAANLKNLLSFGFAALSKVCSKAGWRRREDRPIPRSDCLVRNGLGRISGGGRASQAFPQHLIQRHRSAQDYPQNHLLHGRGDAHLLHAVQDAGHQQRAQQ